MSSGATATADESESAVPAESSVSAPGEQELPDRELTHEEFDPTGTLALILVYFGILVLLWVFMYFVEFLGNDLTVVGTLVEGLLAGPLVG